jgi:hypothetical protein
MAKAKSTIPKGQPEKLPHRIPVPGGQATFFTKAELPPRRQRELNIYGTALAPAFARVQHAKSITIAGEQADGEPSAEEALANLDTVADLSTDEVRMMLELDDVSVWAYLKAWTLTDTNGNPRPLPASPDDILDLERPLYDALTAHARKLYRENDMGAGFTVDSVEDPTSPTGDSEG